MKLLIDTHYIIWLATDRSQIRQHEFSILNDIGNQIFASTVSIWEIRLKWNALRNSGDRKGSIDPLVAVHYLASMAMNVLPLMAETAATPLLVPITHKDPFDELLLVQAQQTGARLFTRDRALAAHPLAYQSV